MDILESEVLEEIGMNIITTGHFIITEHQRLVLKIYIAYQMSIAVEEVTPEIFNAWVSCKEDLDDIEDAADCHIESIDLNGDIDPYKQLRAITSRVVPYS